jgi:hypothetical protein
VTIYSPIYAGLQRLMTVGRTVDLLNLYQGAPIVYPATVRVLESDHAVLRVPGYEVVCLTLEPSTILLNQILEEAVAADVRAVDLAAGTVTLSRFRYASSHVGDRMTVRVTPRDPVPVALECGGQRVDGELADMSINGLGVHVPVARAGVLRPRAVVHLKLALPQSADHGGDMALDLSGAVRFVKTEGEVNRVGIVFAQDVQMLTILHYVRERQTEILADLKSVYKSRLEG